MRLSKFISRFIFSIAFISTLLAFFVSIVFQYMNFEKDKLHIKNEFIESQKNELKKEIQNIFTLIDHEEEISEKIKNNSKNSVDYARTQEETKNHILDWLSTYRFGTNGYVFVNTLDNKALTWNGKKLETPIEYPIENLYQKQLEVTKNPEGGYFNSKFKKLNSVEEFDKINFARKYEKYNWIIGTGVYLDEIEHEIKRKEDLFKETVFNQIKSLLLIFILILIGVYVISKKISKYINTNIKNLTLSFEKASIENKKIDTNNLTYKEFISLANNLNITLENKNETEKKLQDYINIVNENIIISTTDKDGYIIDASEAFCSISGFSKNELVGRTHSIVKHPDTPKEFYKEMWETLLGGKEWKGEIKNMNKQGKSYWVLAIIKPIFKDTEIIGFTALRTNITNKKFIEQLSITDELTQLYNRRFFNTKIEEEINRAKRENNYLNLLIIDIDYFKQYNDTYGHQEGDLALEKIATIFKNRSNRASDFAFRLGGEEFGIITTLKKEKAIEFANILKEEVANLKIEHKTSKTSEFITISIGLVSKKGLDISNSNILYKEADDALYKAKKQGRNCIFIQE